MMNRLGSRWMNFRTEIALPCIASGWVTVHFFALECVALYNVL
jgi:hypothetical protein